MRDYTFDIYTALVHTIESCFDLERRISYTSDPTGKRKRNVQRLAVGLTTDGVAPSDVDPSSQRERQEHFPLSITDIGISFDCLKGEASMPDDEQRIKQAIKSESQLLNRTVHAAVAGAVLSRVLKDDNRAQQYLAAIQEGELSEVIVSDDVSNETVALLVDSLDVVACESLVIVMNGILTVLPPNLGRLQSLTSLNLENCRSLSELPPSLGELQSLTSLNLEECHKLSGEVKDSLEQIVKARVAANKARAAANKVRQYLAAVQE